MNIHHSDGAKQQIDIFGSITDLDVQALVDNELDGARKIMVETAIQNNPCLLQKYESYHEQKSLLQLWWKKTPENT